MPKIVSFWKYESCGQAVLPDRSVLIGPKLLENVNIWKFRLDILSGQKFIKNAKNGWFWRLFEILKFEVKKRYQTGHFKKYKIAEKWQNDKIENFKCDILRKNV